MTFDIAQMIADREAGTPGEWVYEYTCIGHTVRQPGEMNCGFGANHAGKPEPDARRIARVPFLEAEILRLTARVAALEGVLKYYENTFCEGFCEDFPAGYTDERCEGDCSGCKARAALSTPTEEPKT